MTTSQPLREASAGQQALWQHHQLNPASPAYNMVAARELRADLDPATLCQAFAQVVRHCETLHCGYREQDGKLWMYRPEHIQANTRIERIDDLDSAGVAAWIAQHADQPFDLAAANICRLDLLQSQGRLYLCMAAHHISGDFLSVEWMLKLTFAAYHAALSGEALDLPPAGLYFDWLDEQRTLLAEDKLEAAARYWRNQLSGSPTALALPRVTAAGMLKPCGQGHDHARARLASPVKKSSTCSTRPSAASCASSPRPRASACTSCWPRCSRCSCTVTPARMTSSSARRPWTGTGRATSS